MCAFFNRYTFLLFSVFSRNVIPLRLLQPIVIDFNTGDEIKLEQSSLSSSNSTLFSVSLRTNLKVSTVSIWVFLLSHLGRRPNSCLQAPAFGGRVCVAPNNAHFHCALLLIHDPQPIFFCLKCVCLLSICAKSCNI